MKTPGRKRPATRPAESEFLDPLTKTVKVATRAGFVGRRRLLQNSLRLLRQPNAPPVGLLLHGQGGRGKSSVAARICDRLRRDFQRIVVIGRLDETSLINAWAPELADDADRQALRDPGAELRYRIEAMLKSFDEAGRPAPLFVLDDFEQNQPGEQQGDLELAPHAAAVLLPLFEALTHTGIGRVLITCRYALPAPYAEYLDETDVPPLDATEQKKQSLRLDQKATRQTKDAGLLAQARTAADGNPRLFEWLHQVLARPGLDHAAILAEMQQAEEKFREHILARRLIASLPEESRVLLGRMLLLGLPVPLAAVQSLDPARSEATLRLALAHAADLSLVDITEEDGQPHYRVPRQLDGGDPPLRSVPAGAERAALAGQAFEVLYRLWWTEAEGTSEIRMLELIRLAAEGERREELVLLADRLTTGWLNQNRYRESQVLLESVIEPAARHHALLLNLAWAVEPLGHGDLAGELLREAADACPPTAERERSDPLFHFANWLRGRGQVDEALGIYQSDSHPRSGAPGRCALEGRDPGENRRHPHGPRPARRGPAHPPGRTTPRLRAPGRCALEGRDPGANRRHPHGPRPARRGPAHPPGRRTPRLRAPGRCAREGRDPGENRRHPQARGQLDEALRIRQEEQLPVYERLGDVRSKAVTQGKIADILWPAASSTRPCASARKKNSPSTSAWAMCARRP